MLMDTEGAERPTSKERPLETFEEKLNFLHTRFVTGEKPIKVTYGVLEPGDEPAEISFGGDLFIGQLTEKEKEKIKIVLGVDLDESPDFRLRGKFEFDVWSVPNEVNLCVLYRRIEEEDEVLVFEEANLELFEEIEGLKRVFD